MTKTISILYFPFFFSSHVWYYKSIINILICYIMYCVCNEFYSWFRRFYLGERSYSYIDLVFRSMNCVFISEVHFYYVYVYNMYDCTWKIDLWFLNTRLTHRFILCISLFKNFYIWYEMAETHLYMYMCLTTSPNSVRHSFIPKTRVFWISIYPFAWYSPNLVNWLDQEALLKAIWIICQVDLKAEDYS